MTLDEFPVWMLVQRGEAPWGPVMLVPGYAVTFSSHTLVSAFLQQANEPSWEPRVLARTAEAVAALVRELKRQGVSGIALDPDGAGNGTLIPFRDMEVGE